MDEYKKLFALNNHDQQIFSDSIKIIKYFKTYIYTRIFKIIMNEFHQKNKNSHSLP